MSRVFKFRVWEKPGEFLGSKPKMIDDLHVTLNNGSLNNVLDNSAYEFMQYTGCIDKNGKEIYEGDIVRDTTTDSVWAVTWNAEAAGWTDQQDNDNNYSYGLYKSLEHCMEVIGNIYENPDLLQ